MLIYKVLKIIILPLISGLLVCILTYFAFNIFESLFLKSHDYGFGLGLVVVIIPIMAFFWLATNIAAALIFFKSSKERIIYSILFLILSIPIIYFVYPHIYEYNYYLKNQFKNGNFYFIFLLLVIAVLLYILYKFILISRKKSSINLDDFLPKLRSEFSPMQKKIALTFFYLFLIAFLLYWFLKPFN